MGLRCVGGGGGEERGVGVKMCVGGGRGSGVKVCVWGGGAVEEEIEETLGNRLKS